MAELLVRRSGSRSLGPYRLVRRGSRVLGGSGLVAAGAGGGGAPAAVGGAALLEGEANGFAADFTYATDAKRVAVKASGVVTEYAVDAFFGNAGTSPKQVTDVAGTLVWSPHNLLLRSSEFDNGSWTKTGGVAVTSINTVIAPDGTLTAEAVDIPAVSGGGSSAVLSQQILTLTTTTYTLSVWLKGAVGGETTYLQWTADASSFVSSARITLTTAWTRYTVTGIAGNAYYYSIGTDLRDAGQAATAAGTIHVWGAQVNRGSTTAYLPTTTAARYGLALDHDPVTHAAKGLLCEPAATNLLLRSAEFEHANWGPTGGTVAVNAIAAPNGSTEGDAFIPANGSGVPYLGQGVTTVAATTYTVSGYFKNGTLGNNWLHITIVSSTAPAAWFNLATGVKGTSVASPISYNITSVGSGWYRVDMTFVAGSTGTTIYLVARPSDGSTGNVVGDGVKPAFYVWGLQLETGTVATSHIPTIAASATRAVDNYTVTPAAIGHSATAGSWWVENQQLTAGTSLRVIGYTTTASTPMYFIGTTPLFGIYDGGGLDKTITGTFVGTIHKVASAWQSGDRAITANGLAAVTDTGPTTVLLSPGAAIAFGSSPPSGGTPMNGYIRKAYYLPRRMPNAELVTETTP